MELTELIGYIASGVLVISFLMGNVRKLRWINSIGCMLFIVYAMMHTPILWPVAITNIFIVFANLYHLNKYRKKE